MEAVAIVPAPATVNSLYNPVLPLINFNAPNPVSQAIRVDLDRMSVAATRIHALCLASTSPERTYTEGKSHFGEFLLAPRDRAVTPPPR